MKTRSFCAAAAAAVVPALLVALPAVAQDGKGLSERECRNVDFPGSEESLVRACDAQYALCANPPRAWQEIRQVIQVCELLKRERQVQQAAKPGVRGALLARPAPPNLKAPEAVGAPVAPAPPAAVPPAPPPAAAPSLAVTPMRALPLQVAPAVMPAQPAPVVNPSSPDEAVLAPYPRGFDIAPGARRYDGFAVGQPGPVRVMVRSAQPVVVALRRPDGRRVERTGSGDLAIDDVASDADVRQALFWGVSIQPQMPGSGAQGQIMVTAPPADPQAVRAALERGRQAGAQQAQAAIGQAPASGFDPAVALAAQQRELDQQALARHNAALRQIQAQLHPDTAAVMTQAQQARVQGQTLAQAQGAMVNDTRIARLAASGASMAAAPAGNAVVAPARGRLLTAPGAAPAPDVPGGMATAQGGGAPAQAGGAPSAAAVTNALNRMFQSQPNSAPPAGGAAQSTGARPLVTSSSVSEGDPGTPVMLQGSGFGDARGEVRFIVANGRDLAAPVTFWSATQIVTEVPATEGVREFPGQVYVKRADGTRSDLRAFAFKPALERRQVVPSGSVSMLSNGASRGQFEDALIHPYALLWSGPSNYPQVHLPYVQRLTHLFGGSGRDEYFMNARLANGWRVESCTLGSHVKGSRAPYVSGAATVTVVGCPVGKDALRTAVDWWFDFGSSVIYSLTLNIVGPKGVPHQ